MENEENQNQVSLRFPPPLEIAPRFPQSHNPDDDSPLPKTQNQKARKEPQRLKKPQPPSSGSSFDEKMLRGSGGTGRLVRGVRLTTGVRSDRQDRQSIVHLSRHCHGDWGEKPRLKGSRQQPVQIARLTVKASGRDQSCPYISNGGRSLHCC